ncbi:MAG: 3-isopropylmalate dehydratase small subunit [Candidatus Nealsonbacteria bacterium]
MCERTLNDCSVIVPPKREAIQLSGWGKTESKRPEYSNLLSLIGGGQHKDFSGKVFYLPVDNVDTDQIIPAKYLTETKKEEFGKHCLEDASISSEDRPKLFQSQIIVAGDNFGCGSSREHAPWALEGVGIRCVIAPSFARIFENNMFANGLLCITFPKETIEFLFDEKPEELSVDWEKGIVKWDTNGDASFEISDYQKELIKKGGSVGIMLKLAADLQAEGKI